MVLRRVGAYPAELREAAARMVLEQESEHLTRNAAIVSVSEKIGCADATLAKWVQQFERRAIPDHLADGERLMVLERENRELRQANEILRKAVASGGMPVK